VKEEEEAKEERTRNDRCSTPIARQKTNVHFQEKLGSRPFPLLSTQFREVFALLEKNAVKSAVRINNTWDPSHLLSFLASFPANVENDFHRYTSWREGS